MKYPFPTGVPVSSRDLDGRDKEIKDISELLKGGQSVILVSPRRYGKTSIVLEVIRRLKKDGFYTAYIDIFGVLTKRELAEKITNAVLENRKIKGITQILEKGIVKALKRIEIKGTIEEYEFILNFVDPKVDENTLLGEALNFPEIFSSKAKREIIFAYDEFGDLSKLNGLALLKKIRSVFQNQHNTTYIFTGSQESIMTKLFSSKKEPFFRFGRIIHLPPIPRDSFITYIKDAFSLLKIDITPELIQEILNLTRCYPYYTQLLCQTIYYSVKGERSTITNSDIKEVYHKVILSEASYFEELWRELLEKKYSLQILKHLALKDNFPYRSVEKRRQDIYYALSSLEENGYIERKERGSYIIKNLFFKEYIRLKEYGQI